MGNYDDIINLPHHVSKIHPPMSMLQRASQFAPFAALTGHGAAIEETARLTDKQMELDDDNNDQLNKKITILSGHLKEMPEITVTYFLHDQKKSGGSYQTLTGHLKKIEYYEQQLIMSDGQTISLPSLFDIDSKIFDTHDI